MPRPDRESRATRRVRRNTDRWHARLILAALGSLLLHASPIAIALALRPAPVDIDYTVHTVEIGLEDARPGAPTPSPPSHPATQLAPTPPTPRAAAPVQPPRPSAPRPPQHPTHVDSLPPPPELHLHEPDDLLAERPRTTDEPPWAALHEPAPDAGAVHAPPSALPALSQAASDLAPLVPRGSLVTLLLRSDHLRGNPDAGAVRRLLESIPDWNMMLGGSDLDPVRDVDTLLLAASQPFGTREQPPDWFVIAKGLAGSDARLRHAIEQMASPRAPSPLSPPPLDGGVDETAGEPRSAIDGPDGGRLSRVWRTGPGGLPTVTLERYYARRSFVLLGGGMAAIALPGQVERLASAMARRPPEMLGESDDRSLVLLLEVEGARNLLTVGTYRGAFPMPTRVALALHQTLDAQGHADGSAALDASLQYDTPADADHAREMFEYARTRWHVMIAQQLGARGGLNRLLAGAVAGMAGIDIDAVESSIDAVDFRAQGDRVTVHGGFTAAQVRALLNAASVGAGGAE